MGNALAEAKEGLTQQEVLSGIRLFSGTSHPSLAEEVAQQLGIQVGKLTATRFSDGEIRIMVEENARGNDIFILQPTSAPVNETYMELFIMIDAFRRASARRITVVMPYYGYARQDKKVKPREPITARLVADFLEKAGANRVVTVDLHAQQIQGFFNIPVDNLYGGPLLGDHLCDIGYKDQDDVVVVSPDVGGVGRAKALSGMLGCTFVVIAKRRPEPNKVEVVEIVGEFEGKRCVMIDDMIDTGGSIVSGAHALLDRGAKDVLVCCSHPIFSGMAPRVLQESRISRVITLDTIPIPENKRFEKLTVLSSANLLAEAIRRIQTNESVSELFRNWR